MNSLPNTNWQQFLWDRDFKSDRDHPRPLPKTFYTQQDVEMIKQEAFAAGRVRGLEEATTTYDQDLAICLQQAQRQLEDLEDKNQEFWQACQQSILGILEAVCQKMVPTLLDHQAWPEIAKGLDECARLISKAPAIAIRVHPSLVEKVTQHVQAHPDRVKIVGDDQIAKGDCQINWEEGSLTIDHQQIWATMQQFLNQSLTINQGEDHE